jgi:hypothetical protein
MARGKDDDNTPQSDRDRRVLEQDQAPLSTELREPGLDHRARGERESGGAAWEAAAEKVLHDKAAREQTGRDVAGQDQRGRPDVELDRKQQQAREVREAQQRDQLQRQGQAEIDRQNRIALDQHKQAVQEQRTLNAGHQAAARGAQGRERDALTERDQRYANTDHYRESAREDAKQAYDLDRGADAEDEPAVASAEEKRADALMAEHDRKRGVAFGDENRGRAEDARAARAAGEARDHDAQQRPEPPPPKQQAGGEKNLANEGSVAPAGNIKGAKRGTRGRIRRAGKQQGRSRDRGRERQG